MCKCCQSCLETLYWNCIEERFCWDESIAEYTEWEGGGHGEAKGLSNGGASMESLPVTRQPASDNNNHLHYQYQDGHREVLMEVPILAPNIYQVFSKSMIFKDDPEFKKLELEDSIINNNESGFYHGNVGKVVSFKNREKEEETDLVPDETPFSDFEIMFQDELYKIDEEEEEKPKSPNSPDEGISMRVGTEEISPIVDEKLSYIETPEKIPDTPSQKVVLREDSTKSLLMTRTAELRYNLPRAKSALNLPRSDSIKSFTRNNSRHDLIKRVDSAKNLKNLLARLPQRSASFLSVPNLIDPDQPNKSQSDEVFTISSVDFDSQPSGEYSLISRIPDTPVIKGALPKFFAETPNIPEYKAQTSLQSITKTPDVIFAEFDYSMPRYYAKRNIGQALEPSVHASKSMPDLNEDVTDKVSKRLVKIRSKLKPLLIKRNDGDQTRHSNQELNKF